MEKELYDDDGNPWKGIPHISPGFLKDPRTMQLYVSKEMADRMKKAAAKLGVSRSQLARVAIEVWMREQGIWSLRGPKRGS